MTQAKRLTHGSLFAGIGGFDLGIPANWPWRECKATGYPPDRPDWMTVWLMIVADNTLHLTINFLALRYL